MLQQILRPIIVAALCVATNSAFSKGATVQLSITGPGLVAPIHTSDKAAIGVSVWGGDFADWDSGAVEEPPENLQRYLVHFWVQAPRDAVEMKYVVTYVWDPKAGRALIHLPGPRDIWHQTNVYSILRRGQDGHWFYATEKWGEAIARSLKIPQASFVRPRSVEQIVGN